MRDERGHYIQIRGGLFHLEDPTPDEICIKDIAHALSHTCRYAGHPKYFYSVAQHAMLVSYMCDPRDALWGLMHDAAEAYVGDATAPLKAVIPGICPVEDKIFEVIRQKYGLFPETMPPSVKWADRAVVVYETKELFGIDPISDWGFVVGDKPHSSSYRPSIFFKTHEQTKAAFLYRYKELTT